MNRKQRRRQASLQPRQVTAPASRLAGNGAAPEAAFEARLLEVVEAERPALIVPGRDDDLPILAAMRERLAELGAFALVGSPDAVDICGDKYRTAKVFRAAGLPFTETAASRD
ncbi:MAG: hypothetical protein O7G83_20650, partial [Proteobacteria bacterium]|nr:hypothetical protein [Pseudomonadota bacterium]